MVVARLSSPAAGTASGAPNATALRFSFTVGRAVRVPPRVLKRPSGGAAPKPVNHQPAQSFESEPDLHPPIVTVSGRASRASGDVFLTAQDSPQNGPMILDPNGQLVWFEPITNKHISALDLRVQRYQRKD